MSYSVPSETGKVTVAVKQPLRDGECFQHVFVFPGIVKSRLRYRILLPHKQPGAESCTENGCDSLSDNPGLIVSSAPVPFPMQGNRNYRVDISEMRRCRQAGAESPPEMDADAGVPMIFQQVADMPVSVIFVIEEQVGDERIRFVSDKVPLYYGVEPVGNRMIFPLPVVGKRNVFLTFPAQVFLADIKPAPADYSGPGKQHVSDGFNDIQACIHFLRCRGAK